jgi:3-oxoacyl-[acyl-carrier-protein] synthase-3
VSAIESGLAQAGLARVQYVIGEIAIDVDSLPNKTAVLEAHQMPNIKEVWGWEYCRKSSRDALALAIDTSARSLGNAIAPGEIDAIIVCCGDRLNYYEQNRFIAQLAGALQLDRFQSHWLGGSGCVTLFSAVKLASGMVATGAAQNILVVAVDSVPDDSMRFQRFGVLSDGACSFIVTDRNRADFAIIDTMVLSSTRTLEKTDDFQAKCALVHEALDRFGQPHGYDFDRVEALFVANVFLPIQELEMSLLPADGSLVDHGNTARYGHCYAADPFINLVDFYRRPENSCVRASLMTATAHGHFGIIGLERL